MSRSCRAVAADRVSRRVLRGPVRGPPQGPVPYPADRAVLDQPHDAHLAWVDLLQTNSYLNNTLASLHISPVNWLGGNPVTVIFGLVYGYIPYLILVLYAGLDRIDPALIEAGRDLGLGRTRTFLRVTLPLSRQPILTGLLITVLPMLGDYYTNQMLSGAASTSMLGNVIDGQLQTPGLQGQGAVLSVLLLLVLLIPMVYYVLATNRSSREAA